MVKYCLDYARRCKSCQFYANFIHQPPEVLHLTVASWTFDAWRLDVVGLLPKSSSGHLYIMAATDYFSKWAEAVALKEVKKENITNNGKTFDNRLMNKICDLFGFKQHNSSMYNAAANVSIIIILGHKNFGVYGIPGYAALDFENIILNQIYNNDILSVYEQE
ncbi:uncharacterized protein [Nicotiana tomentosiformis]|uniref:uncharacterized protein n=1 Tax=Nicotiana tomentosiformis TaxID=4098 RepID=UPI00388CC0B6